MYLYFIYNKFGRPKVCWTLESLRKIGEEELSLEYFSLNSPKNCKRTAEYAELSKLKKENFFLT
jgi:hypothetical protein